MTLEITGVTTVLSLGCIGKLITLVVIATGLAYQFSGFLLLPYSSKGTYPTKLEQLLNILQPDNHSPQPWEAT